jgi:hypothetical protein
VAAGVQLEETAVVVLVAPVVLLSYELEVQLLLKEYGQEQFMEASKR